MESNKMQLEKFGFERDEVDNVWSREDDDYFEIIDYRGDLTPNDQGLDLMITWSKYEFDGTKVNEKGFKTPAELIAFLKTRY